MNKHIYPLLFWAFALFLAQPSYAQYIPTPPAQDGNISDAEYGNVFANNQNTNRYTTTNNNTGDGGTWYMTWDANNLYVAKTGGGYYEPTIMYLDVDPLLPVTGGGNDKGNLYGQYSDYSVTPKLPFRADVRVLVSVDPVSSFPKIEVQRLTGNGQWSSSTQANLSVYYNGTNREFRLGWNTLTGGGTIPAAFNWFGYASNTSTAGSNYRYDQAPTNPGSFGTAGEANPSFEYYYTVASTANGSATKPFLLKSYTVPRETYISNFGAIDVWDFTMNSPNVNGQQYFINRNSTGGNWNISGSLVVGAGIVYFGSGTTNFGDTNVGNIRVLGNGVLYMDQSNKPILVREDVDLTGGGQFRMSGEPGGDLSVGRNFYVRDVVNTTQATFQPFQRTVTFTGGGITHLVEANIPGYELPFGYLTLNTVGAVTLGTNTNLTIGNDITFNQGLLYTSSNYIQLSGTSSLLNESAASHIEGTVRISQTLTTPTTPVQAGTKAFGNLGLSLTPQGVSAARGTIVVTRVTGTPMSGVGVGSNGASIKRYFILTSSDPSVTNLNLQLVYAYRTDELNSIQENNLALYQSNAGTPGSYTQLTTPPTANTIAHTITFNYQIPLLSGTYFTLGDGVPPVPLPVKLVSFTAKATSEGAALLRWNTASETGSKGFGIERQLGAGEPWKSVGYVNSNNSATGGSYEFLDKSLVVAPASAQAYYRLRQEDLDGTLSYSPVAVITRTSAANATELVLSPVPVSGTALSLTFAEAGQAGSQVTVSNTQGQHMLDFTTAASSEVALSLPVEQLAPGVYIVRVQVPGQSPRYARFVKQ